MEIRTRLRRLIPKRETLVANRWLRWLTPWLGHPALWHWSRRGVALGVALGIFFGLLIPLAQIPVTAAAAIVLRANLPAAAASTLVTNPVTFGPVYFAAYRLGNWLTGAEAPASSPPLALASPVTTTATVAAAANAATTAAAAAVSAMTTDAGSASAVPLGSTVTGATGEIVPSVEEARGAWRRVMDLGKPLLVGLTVMATMGALATYFGISVIWRWRVMSRRRSRKEGRREASA